MRSGHMSKHRFHRARLHDIVRATVSAGFRTPANRREATLHDDLLEVVDRLAALCWNRDLALTT
jgi:hypothetical protein